MPHYFYQSECTVEDYIASDVDGLHLYIDPNTENYLLEPLVWQEFHYMSELPDTMPCPVTGKPCTRRPIRVNFLIKGDFLKDAKQSKILSNIYRLENDDPYEQYRPSGEADEKITKWRKDLKRIRWRKDGENIDRREKEQARGIDMFKDPETGNFLLPGKERTTVEF